ncbi:MAG: Holliday junction resolvase RuvX [Pseudomonadota bacterium]|nr:Holliday junction resolvase RuvX [Gammaproteobacteria bacterium]MBU1559038.1 Holliday junction resolvase RuvX [Gammaproteobacteria bacterium]MBU1926984.1 Holliday junction resolvase RuvX [Gammaproteobacteria bacterium]MBU2546123.1 Holliday junction resolvase RuvX [Gammaproteobacteria bacterium]
METFSTLMGFDFGTRSIGIAVGQSITKTAQPLTAVTAIGDQPNWRHIASIIDEWKPDALIVGIPLNMEGEPLSVTQKAQDFADQLRERFNKPVFEADERLTTKEARAVLFKEKGFKGLEKSKIDALSAMFILESWMRENLLN